MQHTEYLIEAFINYTLGSVKIKLDSYKLYAQMEIEWILQEALKVIPEARDVRIKVEWNTIDYLLYPEYREIHIETNKKPVRFWKKSWTKSEHEKKEEIIKIVTKTLKEIKDKIEEIYESYIATGELVLIKSGLKEKLRIYIKKYTERNEKEFKIAEGIVRNCIDDILKKMSINAKYILPIVFDYICYSDELPHIIFMEIEGKQVKTFTIKHNPKEQESEVMLQADCDREKLYFVSIIVNIFESEKMKWEIA